MTNLNVHDLIALKGAGEARRIVKKEGLWDEFAAPIARKVEVTVSYEVRLEEEVTVTVMASSSDEAWSLATEKAQSLEDHDIEVIDVVVKEPTEH